MTARTTTLRPVWADLHLHTVASACAEIEMLPPLIIERAKSLGLELIAVTDHNTIDNVPAVQQAAQGSDVKVLPGMEVQTREEAHIVCLFDTLAQAQVWQDVVYAHLPLLKNRAEFFGDQLVVDHEAEFLHKNERLLQTSTDLSVDQVVAHVADLGGLTIAAHVDRMAYSLLANLGFIPAGLGLNALELSRHTTPEAFRRAHPELADWPLVHSGDAHRLTEMCTGTQFKIATRTCSELAMALQGKHGRCTIAFGSNAESSHSRRTEGVG